VADVRGILSRPWVYEFFSRVVGGGRARVTLVGKHVRPWDGARILDLGCGPGTLLGHLGSVEYVGIDVSEDYIAQARRQFGDRASFRVGDATRVDPDLRNFDLVLAFGVLHHLDDTEAARLFAHARRALSDDGRLVTLDNTLLPDDPRLIADRIVAWDRGDHVRSPAGYEQLARPAFSSVESTVYRDLLRMPYTHCVLECGN
jgi:SAM-dependent methyltransferase